MDDYLGHRETPRFMLPLPGNHCWWGGIIFMTAPQLASTGLVHQTNRAFSARKLSMGEPQPYKANESERPRSSWMRQERDHLPASRNDKAEWVLLSV